MRSLPWSVRLYTSSLIRAVLMIHRVRHTTEFHGVGMRHFPLRGDVFCLDTIGHITNPSLICKDLVMVTRASLNALSLLLGHEAKRDRQPRFAL